MAYASFRCLVDAPLPKVWESICETVQKSPNALPGATAIAVQKDQLQPRRLKLHIHDVDLQEILIPDPEKGEITLRLDGGQALYGERRFAVREDKTSAKLIIESSLNWQVSDKDFDRRLHTLLDTLVRDIALEIKLRSET